MNYRPLGATDLEVSEIGFGTWGLGGDRGGSVSYGPTDDAVSRDALRAAVDCGINFFDTSDLYGFGHSEALLGETLASCRDRVVIASKGGFVDAVQQDFSVAHLRAALDGSLQRLRTDYIDLYQLHSPAVSLLREHPEVLALLEEFKAAGKIRAWGFSARSPEEALTAITEFAAPVVQVNFNLTDQRALTGGLFAACEKHAAGVIVRTPLCFGFLTGRYSGQEHYDPRDHRSRWSPEQRERWAQAREDFAFLFSRDPDATPSQIALRFCLSFPAVSTAIPGMLTRAHVLENAAASELGGTPPEELQRAIEVGNRVEFFLRKKQAGS